MSILLQHHFLRERQTKGTRLVVAAIVVISFCAFMVSIIMNLVTEIFFMKNSKKKRIHIGDKKKKKKKKKTEIITMRQEREKEGGGRNRDKGDKTSAGSVGLVWSWTLLNVIMCVIGFFWWQTSEGGTQSPVVLVLFSLTLFSHILLTVWLCGLFVIKLQEVVASTADLQLKRQLTRERQEAGMDPDFLRSASYQLLFIIKYIYIYLMINNNNNNNNK
ncbi:hypothetical protein RFI_14572 [Reticulomyxa filosa]|uniref:Uncharacterized protein n=1 Tax=Reticulomyxa filosa TaxID=46433 RepID=X6NBC6_RETFI|nr:hypothetical protein RFI_14572 [Reticulomyxa filosa]|eukprot:ETO22622.1 hypothetical protein RFI_14572 [Reticulomyxa filosa]